jgi:hypothetical protein
MKIEKVFLDELYRCYSTMSMNLDGQLHLFYASEEKDYPVYAYPYEDLKNRKTVFEAAGGVMSMIPLPHVENQFLAIRDFYLKETPSQARLCWVTYDKDTGFKSHDLFHLPYLHRFQLLEVENRLYLLAATIAEKKEHKEDWSTPGKIYYAELPGDLTQTFELKVLVEGLTRNHGCYLANDHSCAYFASDEGILKITPPIHAKADWTIEKILEGRISEMAFSDLDQDGVEEMITIEPFHGNTIRIYKHTDEGYQVVYTYPHEIDFAHTLVGTTLRGVNSFVGGIRRINSDLFMVQYVDGAYVTTIVDEKVGPANLAVTHLDDCDLIHSSNHSLNHAAVYIVKD